MSLKDKVVKALALRWVRGKLKALRGRDKETGMGKVLKFLDGWKLFIVVIIMFASRVYDAAHNGHTGDFIGAVFAALGWSPAALSLDPVAIGAAATGALAIWGVFSRAYKANQQLRAGSSVSGLLSTEGYLVKAVSDSVKSEIANVKYTKLADDAAAQAESEVEAKTNEKK